MRSGGGGACGPGGVIGLRSVWYSRYLWVLVVLDVRVS